MRVVVPGRLSAELAEWLEQQPQVEKVYYAGLPSHPQHELAKRQQKGFGAVVSFEVKGGKDGAWRFIDATRLFSITANLGDAKSTITHPGTTTHGRLSPEDRAKAGIRDKDRVFCMALLQYGYVTPAEVLTLAPTTRVRHQNADFAFLVKPLPCESTTYAHFCGSFVVATA